MFILLVSATPMETAPLASWLEMDCPAGLRVDCLHTGPGPAATAHAVTAALYRERPDLLLQAGIGGAYHEAWSIGDTALIREDCFADLGTWEDGKPLDLFDLGLAGEEPLQNRFLPNPLKVTVRNMREARGATVSTVSSTPERAEAIRQKFGADIESMEGAALHLVGIRERVPFLQVRTVSNMAGNRNKAYWNIPLALEKMERALRDLIPALAAEHLRFPFPNPSA